MVVLTSPSKLILCRGEKAHDSGSVAATFAWSSLMSSSRAHSVPRETIVWVPELELEWGRVKRNLLLNKELVAPGRIFIFLYTVNNKWGSLIRIIESIRLEKNFKIVESKSYKANKAPKDLNAHNPGGPGDTRAAAMPELGGGWGLLSALKYRMRAKSLAAQKSWEFKHNLSMQNYQGLTGDNGEYNILHGPVCANVVPQEGLVLHPLSRRAVKERVLSWRWSGKCQPAPAAPSPTTGRQRAETRFVTEELHKGRLYCSPIRTTAPSSLSLFIHDATLLPQGEAEQRLEELSATAGAAWTDKPNRAGKASWGMHLKAPGEQGTKSRFPQVPANVPPY